MAQLPLGTAVECIDWLLQPKTCDGITSGSSDLSSLRPRMIRLVELYSSLLTAEHAKASKISGSGLVYDAVSSSSQDTSQSSEVIQNHKNRMLSDASGNTASVGETRVWETRSNLPPALRGLLSFNGRGVDEDWDVTTERRRKRPNMYQPEPLSAVTSGRVKRKGEGPGKISSPKSTNKRNLVHVESHNDSESLASVEDSRRVKKSSCANTKYYKKIYKCKLCSRTFNHPGNLNSHELSHGGIEPPAPLTTNDPQMPYACSICVRKFEKVSHYTKHFRSHREEMRAHIKKMRKPHDLTVNAIVKKADPNDGALKNDDAPINDDSESATAASSNSKFKCCICGSCFQDSVLLNEHELIHVDGKASPTQNSKHSIKHVNNNPLIKGFASRFSKIAPSTTTTKNS